MTCLIGSQMATDIEYINNEVSVVGWAENPAPFNTQCIASFWSTATVSLFLADQLNRGSFGVIFRFAALCIVTV